MKSLPQKTTHLIIALSSFIGLVIGLAIMEIFIVPYITIQSVISIRWLFIILISISILIGAFFYTKFFLKHIFGTKKFSFFINLSIVNFSLIISAINLIIALYSPIFKSGEFIWAFLIPFAIIIILGALVSIIYGLIQNLKLKELDRLKSMFLASMSHELRTPLTSIIGFTRMLLKGWTGEINEEQENQLKIILNSANNLLELINDVIDISKIEGDKLDIKKDRFNLVEEIIQLKEVFSVALEKKGLRFLTDTPESFIIFNDKQRIIQILGNLISNAIKFTFQGKISTKIHKSNGLVEISVEDTGSGIREKDLKKLFKQFSRIIEPGKFVEGTGLGLYLSKKLAFLLGGDIFVKSEFGKGSIFTLSLKLKNEEITK